MITIWQCSPCTRIEVRDWGTQTTLFRLIGYWEGTFNLGIFNMNYQFNSLLKTGTWGSGKVLWVLPLHPLQDLLPPLKNRALRSRLHPYQIPCVKKDIIITDKKISTFFQIQRVPKCHILHIWKFGITFSWSPKKTNSPPGNPHRTKGHYIFL